MERLVTDAEMNICDAYTIEKIGLPSLVLMERAALSVAEELISGKFDLTDCLIICGTGNNGGDGLAVARLLHLRQKKVTIALIGKEERCTSEARQQLAICRYYQIPIVYTFSEVKALIPSAAVIVDALFGIGLSRPVEGAFADLILSLNESPSEIVAVDIPSGLSADTGEVMGIAVHAAHTVTFAFSKIGLTKDSGPEYAGKVSVKDIGIYDDALLE